MATKEEVMEYVEDREFNNKFLPVNSVSLARAVYGKIIDFDKELGAILLDVKTRHGPIDLRVNWQEVDYE